MIVRRGALIVLTAVALAIGTSAADAASWVEPWRGHLSFGYAKLLENQAPGGSLGFSAGVDHPLNDVLRLGLDVDYSLLGTQTVPKGSLVADVDLSAIEFLAMLHYQPTWGIPIARLSGGVGVMGARSAVSSSGAAEFQDYPVSELAPALAFEATVMSRKPAPVRVGIETGAHFGFVSHDPNKVYARTWAVWDLRVAIHY